MLIVVAARFSRLNNKVLSQLEIPLTYRQHRLLVRVSEGHTSLAALAAFGNLTLPTVSESVDGLVRRGLLTRGENPDDRRQRHLELTPLGHSAGVAGQLALGRVTEDLLRVLPEESRHQLHQSLSTIYEAATTYFRSGDPGKSTPGGAASRSAESPGVKGKRPGLP
ncbi:MarR family winged helix-turn-helix transcriptional regulator [Actinomadura sp. HBU206391]|uniref:MarR family winged helix-turn-helix transcriptional regulator n=1 Tax=Actinomadura sp. HBU206391 TaxID=2731692 RepID=UPI00165013C6|nr:MarR family winged helix-turn-helix transcriptional regulator [Actinomadura sp. HBU206391]MBC6461052.1 winged helix-turn-helix transcriptional regulator [Actinomadura sp. HBU206391]